MNDFETELLELIMDTIREDKNQSEAFLRRDLNTIIRRAMEAHDEEVRRDTRARLNEDEIYDEGHEDGYIMGWEDAKQEIVDSINEMIRKNN